MKTSIVILTFNQLHYTKLCIDSIRRYTELGTYEIIVVDNHSTDGTVEWLQAQEDIQTIFNSDNLGFPKGCNQGIDIAKSDNILLLNNDIIVTPNWLYNLNKCLYSFHDIGAVGAVSNCCSNLQTIPASYKNAEEMILFAKKNNISDNNRWEERARLIGYCILIKKEVVEKVGMLDERFSPGNFEDDDYSFRMRKAGYKLILCNDVFIHHFGSVSFNKNPQEYGDLLHINRKKFFDKWGFDPWSSKAYEMNDHPTKNRELLESIEDEMSMKNPKKTYLVSFVNDETIYDEKREPTQEDITLIEQNNVPFTGERLVINKEVKKKYGNVLQEHIERYKLACKYVKDKKVLDAACGTGYGTKMLKISGASHIIGVDISKDCLENAKKTYKEEALEFVQGDINSLSFENNYFDVVISFETIEHIRDGSKWIDESARVLNDDGLFIVSTPNRDVTNPGTNIEESPLNPYHQYEYTIAEFLGELLKQYEIIDLFGQTIIYNHEFIGYKILRQLRKLDTKDILKSRNFEGHCLVPLNEIKNAQPMYLIAVCKKRKH